MSEKYLEKVFPISCFEETLEKDITGNPINIFNSAFNMNWSYAINKVEVLTGKYSVTLTAYFPGTFRGGVGIASTIDNAIVVALFSVLKSFSPDYVAPSKRTTQVPTNNVMPVQKTEPKFETPVETPCVNTAPPQRIETGYQPKEVTESKPLPTGGPSNNPAPTTLQMPKPKAANVTPPAPLQTPKAPVTNEDKVKQLMANLKINEEQATGLLAVYDKYGITKKEILTRYIRAWDQSITKLDKNNIDDFIKWANENAEFMIDGGVNA